MKVTFWFALSSSNVPSLTSTLLITSPYATLYSFVSSPTFTLTCVSEFGANFPSNATVAEVASALATIDAALFPATVISSTVNLSNPVPVIFRLELLIALIFLKNIPVFSIEEMAI